MNCRTFSQNSRMQGKSRHHHHMLNLFWYMSCVLPTLKALMCLQPVFQILFDQHYGWIKQDSSEVWGTARWSGLTNIFSFYAPVHKRFFFFFFLQLSLGQFLDRWSHQGDMRDDWKLYELNVIRFVDIKFRKLMMFQVWNYLENSYCDEHYKLPQRGLFCLFKWIE